MRSLKGNIADFAGNLASFMVAYYAEKNYPMVKYLSSLGAYPVDVQLSAEYFADEGYMVSPLMHGLIMADAYGVPNRCLMLLDTLVRGSFKLHDYYKAIGTLDEIPVKARVLLI